MQIKDLKARQGKVDIVLDIMDVSDIRQFEKFGKQGRVANAVAKDSSGDIKLTLWNDDIDKVKAGDKIKILNGYVSEWQGELQLSTGKFGMIEVVGESPKEEKEMTEGPNEEEDKKIYQESEERLKKIEEEPEKSTNSEEEVNFDEEEVKDE